MTPKNGSKTGAQLDRDINEVLEARRRREAKKSPPRSSGIPSQAEYERRERQEAQQRLTEIEKAPLADRKEAAREFYFAMSDHPEVVAERVGWLLDGNYGHGAMQLAKQVLGSPRMNRSAALTQMVAAFEWQSPSAMTRAAWNKLTKGQQAALEKAVQTAIKRAESEE
jgi:hypothetical protein